MCKNIIIGAGIAVASYNIGKCIGYLKCLKSAINTADEVLPGFKDRVIECAASAITKTFINPKNSTKKEPC